MTTAARPRSGGSARSSLLTVLGEFVLGGGGEVWTSTLVGVLGALGFGEHNARQAIARLSDDGTLTRAAHGRRTRCSLSEPGRRMLTEGEARIYGFLGDPEPWDGRWLLVLASVPDPQRALRHQLKRRLSFLGFGSLTPGAMISPHTDRLPLAAAVLEALEPGPETFLLEVTETRLGPAERLIASAWDLDALSERYEEFVVRFGRMRPDGPSDCFVALTELVDAWRRFPFDDPEIPPELLDGAWPARTAKKCFDECHQRWSTPARRWFEQLEAT